MSELVFHVDVGWNESPAEPEDDNRQRGGMVYYRNEAAKCPCNTCSERPTCTVECIPFKEYTVLADGTYALKAWRRKHL